MKKLMVMVAVASAAVFAEATQYSKLAVITAAKKAGRWEAVKDWVAQAGLVDEFQHCAYLSDEYPQFAAVTNALVTGGVASAAEVSAILAAAKDPAVSDVLLRKVYDGDMQTDCGRTRWHGRPVETTFDTNLSVKVQIYADGYRYEQPFKVASPVSIDRKIAAARRKAAAAKRVQARIDLLTTNMTAEVQALMKRNVWPEDLARLYLQHELNTLVGTNTVNAVITLGK